jgi:3'-phosphoadenosine 5'-phosphosulfate sulfotransferase (PAPS reductase)/FAD synthetase
MKEIYPLGQKHKVSQKDWLEVYNNIELVISQDEINQSTLKVMERIKDVVGNKTAITSFSTGKDSIVVYDICQKMGYTDLIWFRNDLEYPSIEDWINRQKFHDKLQVMNMKQNLKWLSENQHLLFPPHPSELSNAWMKIYQWKGQKRYLLNHPEIEVMFLGRRNKEHNFCGKNGVYTRKIDDRIVTMHSPLYDWSHEEILGYINYNRLELPEYYFYPNGFVIGSGPWARRDRFGTLNDSWHEIYQISKDLVVESANVGIESAIEYLENVAR